MEGRLIRLVEEDKQTLGRFYLFDKLTEKFKCAVLELPDRENKRNISNIKAGVYEVVRRWSKKYGWHYHVLDVAGRTLILIHFGNYYRDTRGCILFGSYFTDIDGDGYRDVTSSKKTMKRLLKVAPLQFNLTIIDL